MDEMITKPPTELWLAIQKGGDDVVAEVKRLLDDGAAIDEEDTCGRTAMWMACREAEHKVVKLLLERGAAGDKTTKEDQTPLLMVACGDTWKHIEVCTMLLDHGVDVNKGDARGMTPLMSAVLSRSTILMRLFISRGATLDATYGCGMIPEGTTAAELAPLCGFDKDKLKEVVTLLTPEGKATAVAA